MSETNEEEIVLQATRTTAGGRLFRLLIGALILVSAAAQFALVPVMPVYAARFGLSGFEQGMVLGATGLATLVVSVPAGTLSDRFGARRITLAAGLLMALATAGQALASDFPALLTARLAFGAGYGMVWTAGLCWLAGAMAGGPPALGGSVAAAGVGGVAGPAASGAIAQSLGLAVPLLATAVGFVLITAGLAALAVRPGPAAPYQASPSGQRGGHRIGQAHRDLAGAVAAVVTAGLSTGVSALLVPAMLHAAGAGGGLPACVRPPWSGGRDGRHAGRGRPATDQFGRADGDRVRSGRGVGDESDASRARQVRAAVTASAATQAAWARPKAAGAPRCSAAAPAPSGPSTAVAAQMTLSSPTEAPSPVLAAPLAASG